MATADKLITVAENVPKVYHAGQLNVIENTSTLKKSASGSAFLLDDISPVTHEMGVKVRGKNLVDDTKKLFTGGNIFFGFTQSSGIIPIKLSKGTYTFSVVTTDGTTTNLYIKNSDNTKILFTAYSENKLTFTLSETQDILLSVYKSEYTSTDDVVTAQLELGTTPTAYTPYVPDLTAIKVKRCGKNLLNQSTTELGTLKQGYDPTNIRDLEDNTWYAALTLSGYYDPAHRMPEYALNGESIKVKTGSQSSGAYYGLSKSLQCNPSTTYTLSYNMENGLTKNASGIGFYDADKKHISFAYCDSGSSFTTPSNCYWIIVCFHGNAEDTYATYSDIQLELGTTATDYEPYKEYAEYTPTADGTVEGVTSLYPSTTLTTDTNGVMIDCEYYKDIDVNDIIERTVTAYTNPKIKTVGYAAFQNCKVLASVNLPNATYIDGAGFMNCELLKFVNIPNVTNINGAAFQNCNALTSINLPAVTTMSSAVFYNCTSLITVDFSAITNFTGGVFANCKALKTVIIRNNTMCTLGTTSAFSNCTLINGTGGYIYVPSSLIDTYKTATNWVTYASKFRALEDYTVDGTTTGALDESKVSA